MLITRTRFWNVRQMMDLLSRVSWNRSPSSVDFTKRISAPVVVKMPTSEDIEYSIATRKDRDAVRRLLVSYYFPEEPLTVAYRHGRDFPPDDLENCLAFIDRGTVFIARLRSPDRPVVGVSIGGSLDAPLNVPISTRKLADIVAFLDVLAKRSSDRRQGLTCYNIHYIAVDPNHRGLSIGQRLVEKQIALAKKFAIYDAVTADATGPFSMRLLQRTGMREVGRMRFDEFRNDKDEQVFDLSPGAEAISLKLKL